MMAALVVVGGCVREWVWVVREVAHRTDDGFLWNIVTKSISDLDFEAVTSEANSRGSITDCSMEKSPDGL